MQGTLVLGHEEVNVYVGGKNYVRCARNPETCVGTGEMEDYGIYI